MAYQSETASLSASEILMPINSNENPLIDPSLNLLQAETLEWLTHLPGKVTRREKFFNRVGARAAELLATKHFVSFSVSTLDGRSLDWIRPANASASLAEKVASDATLKNANEKISQTKLLDQWTNCLTKCGDVLRPDAHDGKSPRLRVLARTYTLATAAQHLKLPLRVVKAAVRNKMLVSFTDPQEVVRISAEIVEVVNHNDEEREKIAAFVPIRVEDIALVTGLPDKTIRRRLEKSGLSNIKPLWGQVQSLWGLPNSLRQFEEIKKENQQMWFDRPESNSRQYQTAQQNAQRRARTELRQRLLAVFPSWVGDESRERQQVFLHVGPTNSGKTYDALQDLKKDGSGWYLAPLRLLAFEIYETLNAEGTPCNLLTGEESITVPGARFTAATIEMFDASRSQGSTIIDEAHMLSDPQRGWAWTRALMETQSSRIHVVSAGTAQTLVTRLTQAAGISLEVIEHNRLTSLEVAPRPWSLATLPAQTILVAFSRQIVLALKNELERYHRSVSVIYGGLPPEVRRRQATRFANRETEICVATDAVGMGLNLPANNVCFFETSKFDGQHSRPLLPGEVIQIGGRAGRFGLSTAGQIGALDTEDLEFIRECCTKPIPDLEFARVAPTPEALALIKGDLAHKLSAWLELQSIPETWKYLLKPMNLTEQIELASMLSAAQVKQLGEATALRLINAPSQTDTRGYWFACAQAILKHEPMPQPPSPPRVIQHGRDLSTMENAVRSADIYLWLSQREEFAAFAPKAESVRQQRTIWSVEIDSALQRKVDVMRRCRVCAKPLPLKYRYSLCNRCYRSDGRYRRDWRD